MDEISIFLSDMDDILPNKHTPYLDFAFGDTVHGDCKMLESDGLPPLFDTNIIEGIYPQMENNKYEIRLHDCMWSGRCKTDMEKNKVTAAKVSQHSYHLHHSHSCKDEHYLSTSPIQPQRSAPPQEVTNNITVVAAKKQNSNPAVVTTVLTRPASVQRDISHKDVKSSIQNIAPGTSLLLNSRFNQQKKQQTIIDSHKQNIIPTVSVENFLSQRERDKQQQSYFLEMRPDSPLSLDDDPPETKHSVDLSACITGSNNISLDTSFSMSGSNHHDIDKILKIKTELEDPTSKVTGARTNGPPTITDVLTVIEDIDGDRLHDSQPEIRDDRSECDSEASDDYQMKSHSPSSGYESQSPEYNSPHSDHSYTRSKSGVDTSALGVETPSDSDEEIDVVSVGNGDKKLPTNPSDKDRRVLQSNLLNRFTSRIGTASAGHRTTPLKRSKDHIGRQNLYTRNADGNPHVGKRPIYSSISPSSVHHHTHNSSKYSNNQSSRKRHSMSSYKDDYIPSNKRSRGKKQRPSGSRRQHANSFDQDEADTIEKRNLHNDMERQRRIGLKNLFEALKRQIPSIKDKDRAPKVNILREAAKLCEQLTREENQAQTMKQQLLMQLQRRQAHLKMLKVQGA